MPIFTRTTIQTISQMKKRYLGLFSVIAMVLAIMAASCSVDSTDSNDAERNGQLKLVLNVPSVPSFTGEAATKAIGVPDPGKKSWEQGDSIIVLLELADKLSHTALAAYLIIGYDGTTWGTDGRAYVLSGDYEGHSSFIHDFSKEGAFISADGSITLPDAFPRAHTYNIIFCYAPGARYDGFNNEFLFKKGQIGLSEEWIGYLDETEIPSNGVLRTSEMEWDSTCSRIRVSAAPGDKVTLKATYPKMGCSSTRRRNARGRTPSFPRMSVTETLLSLRIQPQRTKTETPFSMQDGMPESCSPCQSTTRWFSRLPQANVIIQEARTL